MKTAFECKQRKEVDIKYITNLVEYEAPAMQVTRSPLATTDARAPNQKDPTKIATVKLLVVIVLTTLIFGTPRDVTE